MAESNEIERHEDTYHGFMRMMQYGTLAVFVIALGVVLLIAQK